MSPFSGSILLARTIEYTNAVLKSALVEEPGQRERIISELCEPEAIYA